MMVPWVRVVPMLVENSRQIEMIFKNRLEAVIELMMGFECSCWLVGGLVL